MDDSELVHAPREALKIDAKRKADPGQLVFLNCEMRLRPYLGCN